MSLGSIETGVGYRKHEITVSLAESDELIASLQDPHDSDAIALAQTPTSTITLSGDYVTSGVYYSPNTDIHGYMTYTINADESARTLTIEYRNNTNDGWSSLTVTLAATTGTHFLSIAPKEVRSATVDGALTSWIELGVSFPFDLDGLAISSRTGEMIVPDGFFRQLTLTTTDNETAVDLEVSYKKVRASAWEIVTLDLPNNDVYETGLYPYQLRSGRLTGLLTSPMKIGLANEGFMYPTEMPEWANSVSIGVTVTGTIDVDLQQSLDPFDTNGDGFAFPAYIDSDSSVPMTSLNSGFTGTSYSGAVGSFRIQINAASANSTIKHTTRFYSSY